MSGAGILEAVKTVVTSQGMWSVIAALGIVLSGLYFYHRRKMSQLERYAAALRKINESQLENEITLLRDKHEAELRRSLDAMRKEFDGKAGIRFRDGPGSG